MSVSNPLELHDAFVKAFNTGDLDGLVALYEKNAVLAPEPDRVVTGHGAIREAYLGFLAMRLTMALETVATLESDGLGLIHGRWSLTGIGPDGAAVHMTGRSSEVVRRQPDGTWLFIIDNPFTPE